VTQASRAAEKQQIANDFTTNVWMPGRALLEGRSPLRHYTLEGHDGGSVYPPAATVVTLPLALLPYRAGAAVWLLLLAGSTLGALWLCGVRDPRCYVAAGSSPPVIAGLLYANWSLVLVFAVALIWSWRDRPRRVAPLLGLVIASKLFLWPLVVWLACTRRASAFFLSLTFTVLWSVVGWTAVGFEGIGDFAETTRQNVEAFDQDGVSVAAVAASLGLSGSRYIALAAGLVALGVATARRRRDVETFTWALIAALLASPIVWMHYFALLLIPLALVTPRWTLIWLLPFATFPLAVDAPVGVLFVLAIGAWVTTRTSGLGWPLRATVSRRPRALPRARTAERPTRA
jgi:hypothetical protein